MITQDQLVYWAVDFFLPDRLAFNKEGRERLSV